LVDHQKFQILGARHVLHFQLVQGLLLQLKTVVEQLHPEQQLIVLLQLVLLLLLLVQRLVLQLVLQLVQQRMNHHRYHNQ
jgi:hypothetical protein